LEKEEIRALALSLREVGRGKTAVSLGDSTLRSIDSTSYKQHFDNLHRKDFGYLESREICAECGSDLIAGVCTDSYVHEGRSRIERFSPNSVIVKSAVSSWLLQCLSGLGWEIEREEIAQTAQVDFIVKKEGVIATLNVHNCQLDFETLMADVGKSKESEINAILVLIFAYGISNRSAATYVSTHPEVIFVDPMELVTLETRIRDFDQRLGSILDSIDLSRHLIKKHKGTDFGAPIDRLLQSWKEIVSELPSLACQDPLMIKKYGSPKEVGLKFEKRCSSLLGSMLRIVKLGGKNQPDGAIIVPGLGDEKTSLLLYECKTTKNQPYKPSSRDWRQVMDYLNAFRRQEAREAYDVRGLILLSYEFDRKACLRKQESVEKMGSKKGYVSFLPVTSILKLAEEYVRMLPEIRIKLEYDYSSIGKLLLSPGILSSNDIESFLEGVRQKELRIERDLKFLLAQER
jgi:hypothetical protein